MKFCSIKCGEKCLAFVFGCLLFAGLAFAFSNAVRVYLASDVLRDFMSDYFGVSVKDTEELLDILIKYRDNTKRIQALQNPDKFVGNLREITDKISFKKIQKLRETQELIQKQLSDIDEIRDILNSQCDEIETSIELIEKANKRFNDAYDKNMKIKNPKKTDGFVIFERNIKD